MSQNQQASSRGVSIDAVSSDVVRGALSPEQAIVIERADAIIGKQRAEAVAEDRFARSLFSAVLLAGLLASVAFQNQELLPLAAPWSWLAAATVGLVVGFNLGGRGTFFILGAAAMYLAQKMVGF